MWKIFTGHAFRERTKVREIIIERNLLTLLYVILLTSGP